MLLVKGFNFVGKKQFQLVVIRVDGNTFKCVIKEGIKIASIPRASESARHCWVRDKRQNLLL